MGKHWGHILIHIGRIFLLDRAWFFFLFAILYWKRKDSSIVIVYRSATILEVQVEAPVVSQALSDATRRNLFRVKDRSILLIRHVVFVHRFEAPQLLRHRYSATNHEMPSL